MKNNNYLIFDFSNEKWKDMLGNKEDFEAARSNMMHDCELEAGHEGACNHPSHLNDFRITQEDLTD